MFKNTTSRASLQESALSSIYQPQVTQSNVSEATLKIPDPKDTIGRVRS
jgi:hypothetical protein